MYNKSKHLHYSTSGWIVCAGADGTGSTAEFRGSSDGAVAVCTGCGADMTGGAVRTLWISESPVSTEEVENTCEGNSVVSS